MRRDPHSYADDDQPCTDRIDLQLWVDFLRSEVRGSVCLRFERAPTGPIDLDTRDLALEAVTDDSGEPIRFELEPPDPVLGRRLRVFPPGDVVRIRYRTSPQASALQWLSPEQTAGGRHPFVFTQCQAVHARSVFPCQDTPRVRAPFTAELNVPRGLTAVMAAAPESHDAAGDDRAVFRFSMPQPIPTYLFAFAVGELGSADVGPRSRIYAEPSVLEAAAWEFADVDDHLRRGEALFGPYEWERFDILVMPPSFPYGGMENPRLTFVTPSLLAGDRSLVSVVAHELAHSWTGNLVTNANLNHFWLNEGFTVYAERRIVEALYGEPARALQAAVGRSDLDADIARLSAIDPMLTRLRVDLEGHDPDEVFSVVPYEKGYLFLLRLEQNAGRARFDAFLQRYIERFRFTSIETEDLLTLLRTEFSDIIDGIDVNAWLDEPGLPPDAPSAPSTRLATIRALAKDWATGLRPNVDDIAAMNPDEWQAFLSALPSTLPADDIEWFEKRFQLSTSPNAEIRVGWLTVAARSAYVPLFDAVEETLLQYGRMKYLRPLYSALAAAGEPAKARASEIFDRAGPSYHPVARGLAQRIVS